MPINHETRTKTGLEMVSLNKKKAIRRRCFDCSGFSQKEVKECKWKKCQLFPYRMSTNPNSGAQRAKDIKAYCSWCIDHKHTSLCVDVNCPLWPYRKSPISDKSRDGVFTTTDEF